MRAALALLGVVVLVGCQLTLPIEALVRDSRIPTGEMQVDIPQPTADPGELTSSIEAGLASWCAPTPTYCKSWGRPAMLGAVPSFSFGDRQYRAKVCRQDDGTVCTTVTVVSFCACGGGKVIDLSVEAFDDLAPLSRGVIPVTVSTGGKPGVTLPPTDP